MRSASWVRRASAALLEGFSAWFASAACVWQTVLLVAAWCVAETAFLPGVDPHGFWVLYVLTVYSAITQPVLAYEARRGSRYQETLLANQARTMEALLVIMRDTRRAQLELTEDSQEILERLDDTSVRDVDPPG